ncbi:hypothetical protein SFUMM280S_02406 [Streptomyces fumanus]
MDTPGTHLGASVRRRLRIDDRGGERHRRIQGLSRDVCLGRPTCATSIRCNRREPLLPQHKGGQTVNSPSTAIDAPVMYWPSGPAKWATVAATSGGDA